VKAKVRGMCLAVPVGDEVVRMTISDRAQDVRLSLRTRDPQEARQRQGAVVSYLEGVWRAVREGPRRLSHKETVALAGEAYRLRLDAFGDDPGSAEAWVREEVENLKAEAGKHSLMIGEAGRRASLEVHLGPSVDDVLSRRGLIVEPESRERLLEQLLSAIRQANITLMRRADGDYSPDPRAGRFPSFPEQPVKDGRA
jgi:hypothetical protein